ncbi:N-acyl homoserine lactonase [Thalassovita gelatinovora]|uniref:N-acyl homoserine lactonase n=1 Tax=Thalassovita gelatinovora TaxID=53501 RepID=A0A0P1FWM4_THAGE|nr:MBL fold metallo-hydrolase [Thalassovita gelatinovora]QIZ80356.1 MBL fold metallo-hydrolase [Thalassovita gelatinovora]CUH64300.1 N-acyl homoserine lactonase [Thalassovita gelatinovora]SEQ93659.1 Glyoxylase, beta-lactamase superfamily II [Thalassovita gelatinovora]
MTTSRLTRRAMLAGTASLPLAATLANPLNAAAAMLGAAPSRFNRFTLGGFEVTTLLAGTRTVPDPQKTFGMNVSAQEFADVSAANMIPADKTQFFFTPTVVNTGTELILFDTGLNPAGITEALNAAGYSPDQIDKVVITHMHGDHIGGLRGDTGDTFANASYVTGTMEFDAWAKMENEGFEAKVRPLADRMTMLDDGGSVASGITAMAAFGHTPGHMAYRLESDGKQLLLAVDFANHYVWSLAYPDWEVRFDSDKAMAAITRRKILSMLAADKIPFVGYHMPFPGLGYVEPRADGYKYVAASYQHML